MAHIVYKTMPVYLDNSNIRGAGMGVFTDRWIKKNAFIGFYKGERMSDTEYNKLIKYSRYKDGYGFDTEYGVIDASDPLKSNWTRYMNCSRNFKEENVKYFEEMGKIFFYAARDIKPGEELMFYYGDDYANKLGIFYRA